MIVFINGAFGAGKTTLAERLVARLPGAILYDPEEVGYMLRKVLGPVDNPEDFQDLPMWRSLSLETARQLRQNYGRPLVVPMTVWQPAYFEELVEGMRRFEPQFYHFCLTAEPNTLYRRLAERGDPPGCFAWERVERCTAAFRAPLFATHLSTDEQTPSQLLETILSRVR